MNNDETHSESGWPDDASEIMASEDRWQDVELLRESESGFSAVYRARRHGKWHVLKAIKAEYGDNPIALAQQRKEFDIGYRLSHPGIAAVIGIEDVEGLGMCIVQEWVDGSTLREVMERGDLDRDQAHHITAQLLDALEYIHNRQVVHRDLKPSNIMIAADGNRVKLIDFGVSDTAAHAILKGPAGTRRYAAPELLGGEKIDSRSDLYSLGVIVQELNDLLPHSDSRLKRLAQACCKENRNDRPQSASLAKRILNHRSRQWLWGVAVIALAAILALTTIFWNNGRDSLKPYPSDSITVAQQTQDSSTSAVDTSLAVSRETPAHKQLEQISQQEVIEPQAATAGKPQPSSATLPPSFEQDVLSFARSEAQQLVSSHNDRLEEISQIFGGVSRINACNRLVQSIEDRVAAKVFTIYKSDPNLDTALRNYMATQEGQKLLDNTRNEARKTTIRYVNEHYPKLAPIFNDMKQK